MRAAGNLQLYTIILLFLSTFAAAYPWPRWLPELDALVVRQDDNSQSSRHYPTTHFIGGMLISLQPQLRKHHKLRLLPRRIMHSQHQLLLSLIPKTTKIRRHRVRKVPKKQEAKQQLAVGSQLGNHRQRSPPLHRMMLVYRPVGFL